jgi:hypothetical protein
MGKVTNPNDPEQKKPTYRINRREMSSFQDYDGLERSLHHQAVPKSTSRRSTRPSRYLGKYFSPIIIPMTGGITSSRINLHGRGGADARLRGTGSQRAIKTLAWPIPTRFELSPDIVLFANVGAVQELWLWIVV